MESTWLVTILKQVSHSLFAHGKLYPYQESWLMKRLLFFPSMFMTGTLLFKSDDIALREELSRAEAGSEMDERKSEGTVEPSAAGGGHPQPQHHAMTETPVIT